MLIQFTVGNFRSFKDPVTLSLVAAKLKSKNYETDKNNTILLGDNLKLLTTAAIYGANASGKSNLVRAMAFMQSFVLSSVQMTEKSEGIPIEAFLLNKETSTQPSIFEIVFQLGVSKYRYGFQVDNKTVHGEWLFTEGVRREVLLFVRDENGIHRSRNFGEGRSLEDKTRKNALYLTVVSQFNGPISQTVTRWFQNLAIISGLDDTAIQAFTLESFKNSQKHLEITNFVKAFDVGIDDIQQQEIDPKNLAFPPGIPEEIQKLFQNNPENMVSIQTVHKVFDKNRSSIGNAIFDLANNESHGTQKLFFLSAPILSTLNNGNVLIIDELEARLHPIITCELVRLFNNPLTNTKHAQLIFTTHDTNLLSNKQFRRDQIWFTEKDKFGSTDLYSLSELKVRNNATFENDYIEGKYGAVPFIGNLNKIPQ